MAWLERILLSAAAASLGALITLLWVGDASTGSAARDAAEKDPVRLARLAEDVAAQADMLAQLTADNVALTLRLRELERASPETAGAAPADADSASASLAADSDRSSDAGEELPEPPEVPVAERLARAGIEPALAADIEERLAAMEMERLYLRDQATREGWRNSERFSTAMDGLASPAEVLRGEFGDAVYDQYLYATGQGNRIVVTSTLQDSPARDRIE